MALCRKWNNRLPRSLFLCDSELLCPPLGLESHHTSASLSVALTVYGCTPRGARQCLQLSLCALRTQVVEEQTTAGHRENGQKCSCLFIREARMGQSQARPAEVPHFGVMPPSPRTVCALRLAEPPHRFCCHYQHFSFPERAMSYSPPYSPSLFKRPERR